MLSFQLQNTSYLTLPNIIAHITVTCVHLLFVQRLIFFYFYWIFFITIVSPYTAPQQSPHCYPYPWVLFPFCSIPLPSHIPPPAVILLSIYESVPIFLVSSVCSSDSTYDWNHVIFVFSDWLISLSIMFSSSIYTVLKGKLFFFIPLSKWVVFHCVNVS